MAREVTQIPKSNKVLMCYSGHNKGLWGFTDDNIDPNLCTHLILMGGTIAGGRIIGTELGLYRNSSLKMAKGYTNQFKIP